MASSILEKLFSTKENTKKIDDLVPLLPPQFALVFPLLEVTKIRKVRQELDYHYYGVFSPKVIASEAAKVICENSSASKSSLKKIIKSFITITSYDCQQNCQIEAEAVWLIVSMTKVSERYAIPRWHRDGSLAECTDATHTLHCRYGTTLTGPQTRVLEETELVSQGMQTLSGRRKELADALASEVILDLARGQIIRFSWGRGDSPVHSEPDLSRERVFISCVYGTLAEIRDVIENRRQRGDSQAVFRIGEEKDT